MNHYPVFLDLREMRCLVVGAGRVGRRKIEGLLTCQPESVLVLDPSEPDPRYSELWTNQRVVYKSVPFSPELLQNINLVFAATPDRFVNNAVAQACKQYNILCNVADAPQESDFFVPASVRQGKLCLAISTGGASPALARILRQDLEKWLDSGYVVFLEFLEKLRPYVIELNLGADANAEIFRSLCRPPVGETLRRLLQEHAWDKALLLLMEILPSSLHSSLRELLHELD